MLFPEITTVANWPLKAKRRMAAQNITVKTQLTIEMIFDTSAQPLYSRGSFMDK